MIARIFVSLVVLTTFSATSLAETQNSPSLETNKELRASLEKLRITIAEGIETNSEEALPELQSALSGLLQIHGQSEINKELLLMDFEGDDQGLGTDHWMSMLGLKNLAGTTPEANAEIIFEYWHSMTEMRCFFEETLRSYRVLDDGAVDLDSWIHEVLNLSCESPTDPRTLAALEFLFWWDPVATGKFIERNVCESQSLSRFWKSISQGDGKLRRCTKQNISEEFRTAIEQDYADSEWYVRASIVATLALYESELPPQIESLLKVDKDPLVGAFLRLRQAECRPFCQG